MSLSLADCITAVRDLLNESAAAFFSDAEITRWIQQACLDISTVTHCVELTTDLTMSNADGDYSLPAATLTATHAVWKGTFQAMRRISASLRGEASTDTTGEQMLRWHQWGTVVYVEPIPTGAAGGQNVTIYYSLVTNDVTVLPDSCQLLAIWYGVAMGKMKDKRFAEAQMFLGLYQNGLALRRTDLFQREPQTQADLQYGAVAQLTGGQARG